MPNRTDARPPEPDENQRSASVLGDWIVDNTHLLLGVYALRGLGQQADKALQAVMKVRHLEHTRLSWELWEALAQGHGVDTDALLEERIPTRLLRLAHVALRGADPAQFGPGWFADPKREADGRPDLFAIEGGRQREAEPTLVRARLRRPEQSS